MMKKLYVLMLVLGLCVIDTTYAMLWRTFQRSGPTAIRTFSTSSPLMKRVRGFNWRRPMGQLSKRVPWPQLTGTGLIGGSGLGTYALIKKYYDDLEQERLNQLEQERSGQINLRDQQLLAHEEVKKAQQERIKALQEEYGLQERRRREQERLEQQEQLKQLMQEQQTLDIQRQSELRLRKQEEEQQLEQFTQLQREFEQERKKREWLENWRFYNPWTW